MCLYRVVMFDVYYNAYTHECTYIFTNASTAYV